MNKNTRPHFIIYLVFVYLKKKLLQSIVIQMGNNFHIPMINANLRRNYFELISFLLFMLIAPIIKTPILIQID